MVIALDPQARVTIELLTESDLPPEKRTRFHCRDLTLGEQQAIEEQEVSRWEVRRIDGASEQKLVPHIGRTAALVLGSCLLGWSNLLDENGAEVPFEMEKTPREVLGRLCNPPTDATLARLPSDCRRELSNIIRGRSFLGGADRKNLPTPQPVPSAS